MASQWIRCFIATLTPSSLLLACAIQTEFRFGTVQELTELVFGMARNDGYRPRSGGFASSTRPSRCSPSTAIEAKMQDIAARAGVVPSVLYDHFGSKRELHITLLELHAQQLRDRSLRRLEGTSVEELVRASIASYFEFVEEDPFMWRFLHRDPPADPEIAAVCQELADRGTAGIADLIRFGAGDAKSVKGITVDDAAWILARATQSACGRRRHMVVREPRHAARARRRARLHAAVAGLRRDAQAGVAG